MDDLAAFVAARLDEDEAMANERRGIWPSPGVDDNGAVWLHVKRGGNAVVAHYQHPVDGYGDMADLRNWTDAEQGFTDQRVLREVAAKRGRLALMTEAHAEMDRLVADDNADRADQAMAIGRARAATVAVRYDAEIWSDHPGYRQKWKPR